MLICGEKISSHPKPLRAIRFKTNMKSHKEIEEKLTDYYFGELPSEEEQLVREHLANCSACRQALNQLTSVVKALKRDLVDDEVPLKLLSKEQRKEIFAAATPADEETSSHLNQKAMGAEGTLKVPRESRPTLFTWFRIHKKGILSAAAGLTIASTIWMLVLSRSLDSVRMARHTASEPEMPGNPFATVKADKPANDAQKQILQDEQLRILLEKQSVVDDVKNGDLAIDQSELNNEVRQPDIGMREIDFAQKKVIPEKEKTLSSSVEADSLIMADSRRYHRSASSPESVEFGESIDHVETTGVGDSRLTPLKDSVKTQTVDSESTETLEEESADDTSELLASVKTFTGLAGYNHQAELRKKARTKPGKEGTQANKVSKEAFYSNAFFEDQIERERERESAKQDRETPLTPQMESKAAIAGGKSEYSYRLNGTTSDRDPESFSHSVADLGKTERELGASLQAEVIGTGRKYPGDAGIPNVANQDPSVSVKKLAIRDYTKELPHASSSKDRLQQLAQLDKKEGDETPKPLAKSIPTDSATYERFDLSDELLYTLKGKSLEEKQGIKQSLAKLGAEFGTGSTYILDESNHQLVVVNPGEDEKQDIAQLLDRLQVQIDANNAKSHLSVPPMIDTRVNPTSTFSIDVDTASYTAARNDLLSGNRPDPLAIRQEEFINYFDYKYQPPKHNTFAIYADYAPSPFRKNKHLLRVAIQGKRPGSDTKRPSVFTFVIDTSGSMAEPNRLPMIQRQLPQLLDQMRPQDRVSVVSTDVDTRLVLNQEPISNKTTIIETVNRLRSKGGTNLEEGLVNAYEHAERNYAGGAYNRVVLFSDGVANLGEVNAENIQRRIEKARKLGITFTAIGVGRGLYNDELLETLADKGDGNYLFVDSDEEAKRVFVDNFAANFNVIARDVKIQVEFNPEKVTHYRLIGYDNRRLKKKDFRDDAVDAGEVGAGQSVTALYEVELAENVMENLCEVRLRYKDPDTYAISEFNRLCTVDNQYSRFSDADWSFRLVSIVSEFAEALRYGPTAQGVSFDELLKELQPLVHELKTEPTITELHHLIMQAN